MKTKTRFFAIIITLLLVFGVASCGTNKQGVTFANYESIVTVNEATTENPADTYEDIILLFGGDFISSTYADGNGVVVWEDADESATVTITFAEGKVSEKESVGLYESTYKTPLGEKEGVWEWIVLQLGWFTYHAGSLFGLLNVSLYWLGLLIMTLVIRTLGWPIYAKTNDMSLKMNLAQPELNRIQEKYRNKKDQASQQRMQMETMEIYKKYKINLFGCLMPLAQMPIFIAMYQVVQRFPLTTMFEDVNTNFLWTNLGNTSWLPNLPLALLVAVLMFLSQWLTTKRTTATQKHGNTYQNPKTQQTQKTMKYMMYFMVVMMAYISIGNAGIAFYWIIGTAYQLLQSYVSHRNVDKRRDQLQSRI
ncbi:MAG: YidC/Oxa1 family membrane protein insertase [Candidatus Izemoplasmatales bacterium]